MSLKSRVEAVLFLTDKPVVAAAIAKLVNEDVQLVRQSLLELIHDYEERNCALEIADDDDGYMMQVKDEYANVANDLAPIDLPLAVVRTLSAIAIKQPVMQSDIVRIRGAGAYEHIKELMEKELISKKEEGRSPLLSTTKKFQTYFRLSQDAKALRFQLKDSEKPDLPVAEDQQLQIQDVQADGTTAVVPGDLAIVETLTVEADLAPANIDLPVNIDLTEIITEDNTVANQAAVSEVELSEAGVSQAEVTSINESVSAVPTVNKAVFDDDYITAIDNEPAIADTNDSIQEEAAAEEKKDIKASKSKAKKKVSVKADTGLTDNIQVSQEPTTFQPQDNNAPDNIPPIIATKFSAAQIIN